MANYTATVTWARGDDVFTDKRYSRRHRIAFDAGIALSASASPHVVPLPYSAEDAVDPEEAFVASLASCHLLSFLFVAAKRGFVVDRYEDAAEGTLAKGPSGRLMMTVVTLRPRVTFAAGRGPSSAEHEAMHHEAHDECFIANSVATDVRCEPR